MPKATVSVKRELSSQDFEYWEVPGLAFNDVGKSVNLTTTVQGSEDQRRWQSRHRREPIISAACIEHLLAMLSLNPMIELACVVAYANPCTARTAKEDLKA